MDEKKIILVSVSDLVPGMIVARDVYTRNNQMLVPADTKITESIITRMTFFGIMSIRVFASELEKNIVDEEEEMYMTQQEKEDFAVFKENYELTIDHLSENLNSLLKTADEIDTDELVENVDKLVFQSKSRYEIMNMVHHIRTFDDETYRHSLNDQQCLCGMAWYDRVRKKAVDIVRLDARCGKTSYFQRYSSETGKIDGRRI